MRLSRLRAFTFLQADFYDEDAPERLKDALGRSP